VRDDKRQTLSMSKLSGSSKINIKMTL